MPFSIQYYCSIVQTVRNSQFYLYALSLFAGSMQIRIHNTACQYGHVVGGAAGVLRLAPTHSGLNLNQPKFHFWIWRISNKSGNPSSLSWPGRRTRWERWGSSPSQWCGPWTGGRRAGRWAWAGSGPWWWSAPPSYRSANRYTNKATNRIKASQKNNRSDV